MNAGAPGGGVVYSDSAGWRARLSDIDPERVEWIVRTADESPCGPGSAEQIRIIHDDTRGFWLCCDVKGLKGRAIEVWRMSRLRVRLAGGNTLESSRIIAAVDPCGRYVLDNARSPFLVTEKVHGYDGAVRLYVRFDQPFTADKIESWHPVCARLVPAPDGNEPLHIDSQSVPTREVDK